MANKFAQALTRESNPEDAAKTTSSTLPEHTKAQHSRQGTKHIGGYFARSVSTQLRQIALDEDTTIQALLAEGIDRVFKSRGKPAIAAHKQPRQTVV